MVVYWISGEGGSEKERVSRFKISRGWHLWHPWWELDVLIFQWQVNCWRADRRHQRHVSRLHHPFSSPDYLLARFARRFFFFTNADFFSFFPQCGAWSQANKRLSQRLQTSENTLNLRAELKPLFLESFQGLRMQFQSKRLVMLRMDVYVPANLHKAKRPDKPKIV